MKTLLLNPPPVDGHRYIREGRCMQSVASWAAIWPPLTLATLAALARKHGEVALCDGNAAPGGLSGLLERAKAFGPDVIAVSTGFPSIEGDAACAAALKKACPAATLLGIGQFFTLLETQAMEEYPAFDAGIVGEPEMAFRDLLADLDAADVAGVMRRANGCVHQGPVRGFAENLDDIPYPARDLLDNSKYRLPDSGRPFTLINVARGCPHTCTFCIAGPYHGKTIRRHSVPYILEELEQCQRDFGLRDFLFWEEVFTMEPEFGLALCDEIARKGWDISWATTTRADCVTPEILAAMKRAGCFLLGLGIETSSQAILDAAGKSESVDDMRRAVALCKQAGIRTMGHFVFGLPGETPETAEATVEFALRLGLDYVQCYAAVPYPKTELGALAARNGWNRAQRWSDYDFGGKCMLNIGTIAPEQVDHFRSRMFRRFYLRPGYLARQVATLAAHPKQLFQAARFLGWMRKRR